jgi:hypothetical protein
MTENKYTLCYVDESATAIADFVGEMEPYFNLVEVAVKDREPLNKLVERLKAEEFDYLVVDYHLNQDIHLAYDGDAVIGRFKAIFKDFPCMLLSSDGKGAVTQSEGVSADLVRDKSEVYESKKQDVVIERINKSITQYKSRLASAEEQYKHLQDKKSASGLTLEEEKEATELNELLDESLDASTPLVPIDITNGDRLNDLIKKTDDLIKKIDE